MLFWDVPFHVLCPVLIICIAGEGAQLGATCFACTSTRRLFPEAEYLTCDCVFRQNQATFLPPAVLSYCFLKAFSLPSS